MNTAYGFLGPRLGEHSVWFRNTHRGKRSLRLNLKDPRGKALFLKLVAKADVLVEGFRPGVMQRLGLDYESVRVHAPQIVYCSISAFGQTGRYRDRPAHDMAVQALAGTLGFNLGCDGAPTNPGLPTADITSSMFALAGVLMALLKQRQTGQGDRIDISMHDCLLAWTPNYTGPVFAEHRAHDVKNERNWGGGAFYNIYRTQDGRWMVLGGLEHHFCANFLNKAGRPDLIPLCDLPPGPGQQPVKDFLAEFFAARSQAEVLAWLADIDVCYAPLRTLVEAYDDPHVRERGMLLHDPDGLPHIGTAIRFASEPAQIGFAVPRLGEHSRAIAAELGYAAEAIDALERDGVI